MLVFQKRELLRNLFGLIVFMSLAFFTVGCSVNPEQSQNMNSGSKALVQQAAAGTPVAKYGLLKVVGNKVCDQNGNPVQLRGMSMFWSQWSQAWWNAACVGNLASTWKISIIRAAMGVELGGYLTDPNGQKALVKTVVDAAIANGIYVIIDWHEENAVNHTEQSRAFFTEMANTYKNVPNVIFELYNEPTSHSWSSIKGYAEYVLSGIRGTGAQNLAIVGTRTWSQRVDEAADNPITAYGSVAYTLHFYSGTHSQWLRDVGSTAMSKNIAIFVTEYGTSDSSGNGNFSPGETQIWYNWMNQNLISSCAWEVFDKAETCAAFVGGASTTGPWPDSQLTENGKLIKSYIIQNNNWGGDSGGSSSASSTAVTYAVPGKIEAENYAAVYGIQTEACSDTGGTLDVGYVDVNDWMDYSVNVASAGSYTVDFRVAAMSAGGKVDLTVNGQILSSAVIPSTGGWQTWTTVSTTVNLSAGKQTIRLTASGAGWNINWINLSAVQTASSSSTSVNTQYIPGKIEAESYAAMSGIQTENCSDAGGTSDVGWIDAGDWCDYTVHVATAGSYIVEFRVAGYNASGAFDLKANGATLTSVAVPSTGGWQTWTSVFKTVTLAAGTQTLRIAFTGAGMNFNWFNIISGTASSASSSSTSSSAVSSAASSSVGSEVTYTEVSAPFTFDGSGTYHWKIANIPSYENNWSGVTVTINGMDVSGLYKTPGQLPAKQNGYYYIDFIGTWTWSHFEIK